jgi:hypothetical protein
MYGYTSSMQPAEVPLSDFNRTEYSHGLRHSTKHNSFVHVNKLVRITTVMKFYCRLQAP